MPNTMPQKKLTPTILIARLMRTLPTHVRACLERFNQHGHRAWVVGGALRDLGWRCTPKDWDLAVDGALETWLDLLTSRFAVVVRHGVARVRFNDCWVDISPLKSTHKPKSHWLERLIQDLQHRDLSINAIAVDVASNSCIDPCAGLADLEARILRTPSAAGSIFVSEPIRMLRILRFVSVWGARVDLQTQRAMFEHAWRLAECAKERLQSEITKILEGPHWGRAWILGQQLGFWQCLSWTPGALNMRRARLCSSHQRNTWPPAQKLVAMLSCYPTDMLVCQAFFQTLGLAKKRHQYITHLLQAVRSGREAQKSATTLRLWCHRVGYEAALSATQINSRFQAHPSAYLQRFHHAMRHAPRSRLDLAIDGRHLQALGYQARQIGGVLDLLWQDVMQRPSRNRLAWLHARALAQQAVWGH